MLNFLLITSNIGSLISQTHLEQVWMQQLSKLLMKTQPDIVAIHLQEINGQVGSSDTERLEDFLRTLLNHNHWGNTSKRGFVIFNSEGISVEDPEFAALGAIYWFPTVWRSVEIWDYSASRFVPFTSKLVRHGLNRTGEISGVNFGVHVDQRRFPAELFPSGIASRKGFLRTRWRIGGCVTEFVNVHLFNDSDNVRTMQEHPSIYARHRAMGLRWLLKILQLDAVPEQHLTISGDFNFRLDLPAFFKGLSSTKEGPFVVTLLESCGTPTTESATSGSSGGETNVCSDPTAISNLNQNPSVIIGRRIFDLHGALSDQWKIPHALLPFDKEAEAFSDYLKELPIQFPPSYPFDFNSGEVHAYSRTRCPAWCDRILLSSNMFTKLRPPTDSSGNRSPIVYDMLARDSCVGDHKPVYLYFALDTLPD